MTLAVRIWRWMLTLNCELEFTRLRKKKQQAPAPPTEKPRVRTGFQPNPQEDE